MHFLECTNEDVINSICKCYREEGREGVRGTNGEAWSTNIDKSEELWQEEKTDKMAAKGDPAAERLLFPF